MNIILFTSELHEKSNFYRTFFSYQNYAICYIFTYITTLMIKQQIPNDFRPQLMNLAIYLDIFVRCV